MLLFICSFLRLALLFCESRACGSGLYSFPPLHLVETRTAQPDDRAIHPTAMFERRLLWDQTAPFAFYLTLCGADVIRRLPCHIILENFGARARRFRRGIRASPSRRFTRHWPSQISIMSTHNVLKQLHGLDRTSSQFHKRLSGLLRSERYRSAVPNLQGEDLAWLVDYLESVSIQSISLKSASNTVIGSGVYFKSYESRLPGILAGTQKHLRHQGGPTEITHAFKFSPSHHPPPSFRTRS